MDAEKVEKVEKGLAFCNSRAICSKCNYRLTEESEKTCDDILHADALDVIRELKAENERMKEQKAEYPVCEKCGKEIEHINTSVFNYDGSDSERSIPITYSKENGCVSFSTNQNWTGYDLTDEERKERIRCPYCGKFPFDNSIKTEIWIPVSVDVMMWTSESR